MPTTQSNIDIISPIIGVQPDIDKTNFNTKHYTASDKIRFHNGSPEKIGGWESVLFENDDTIGGVPRSIWSQFIDGQCYTMIGTHKYLYALVGSRLTNVTPLQSASVAVANSLSTTYSLLGSDPFSYDGDFSHFLKITDPKAASYRPGDSLVITGATAFGPFSLAALNKTHVVVSVSGTTVTVSTLTFTNIAYPSGGGATVNRACGLITVTKASHGLSTGDRVGISAAGNTGGILAADINKEWIIRDVPSSSTFDVMTAGTATSSVSSAGGASTVYYPQLSYGNRDESIGFGYGMGLYGVGLYGVSKTALTARSYPRIWFFDRYGDYILCSPGNQGGLYQWDGDTTLAPVAVSGAPTAINYFFVSDNTVVTFGNAGTENRITASDQNSLTTWTGTATNQFYDDNIEGAGRLMGRVSVNGINLIFTEHKAYTFRHIGLPNIWEVLPLANNCGLISPQSAVTANGTAYWMGLDNFYKWSGGNIQIMPANTQPRSTIGRYVFSDLNFGQKSKTFCQYNSAFEEIRWHYPSASDNDPGHVAVTNITDLTWWPDTIERTAAESPDISLVYPRLADMDGGFYNHEKGVDADGVALPFTISTNLLSLGKRETLLSAFIPDSYQSGDITVTIDMYQWPQSSATVNTNDYVISDSNTRQGVTQNGRYWKYTITGEALGQYWNMGAWQEEKQVSGDGP